MVKVRGTWQRLSVKDHEAEGGTNKRDHEGTAGEIRRELRESYVLDAQCGKLSRGKKTLVMSSAA